MRLYHVSHKEIKKPDINIGRKNADLGRGFYTSDSKEFTLMWALPQNGIQPVINIYELDESGLKIIKLSRDRKWLDCIVKNRTGQGDVYADCDVTSGPIANDTLFETLGITTSSILSVDQLLDVMKIGPEYYQTVIKTEKAAKQLTFVKSVALSEEITARYSYLRKRLEEDLSNQFNKTLASILAPDEPDNN